MAKFKHERHGPGGGAVIVCEAGKVQSGASGERMIPPDASIEEMLGALGLFGGDLDGFAQVMLEESHAMIEEKVYKEVAKREARLTRLVKDQVFKGLVDEFSSGHRY